MALSFAGAVILTALALTLSAYFITKAAQDEDALDKAIGQSRFNLMLADSMLPAAPENADYERLVNAFQIRGDFATLLETGQQPYHSGFDVSADLVSADLAAKVSAGRIGYQLIDVSGQPTLVVGGLAHSGEIALYFFYPQGDRLAQLASLRNVLIIAGIVLAVIGALVGYLLARGLVRPVRRASKAAVQMSQGDLGIRLPTGGDEFGVLASSFNRMAENLQAKMLDLEAGQARERRFVADVAHELRTPVAALVGEASLLKTRVEGSPTACAAEVGRLVEMVSADITRLRQLVDDLLEISRLEAQAAETVMEPVRLGFFLDQLVQAHDWSEQIIVRGPWAAHADAREASPEGGPVVLVDRRRLERIVVNLVENALRHATPPVTIETRIDDGPSGERVVRVAVTDTGAGVPPEHLPYVFDRFYKADPSRASSRGSGLGLAIARENARLLGGEVTAANVPGGGARFVISLPAVEE